MNELQVREAFSYSFAFPFTVAGEEMEVEKSINTRGPFELFNMTHSHTGVGGLTFEVVDTGFNQSLMNMKLPASLIAGVGQRPFIVPVTYTFRQNRTIRLRAKNGVTAANPGVITLNGCTRDIDSVDESNVMFNGQRQDLDAVPFNGQFFCYGAPIVFTVAGETIETGIDIYNNRAFECFYILSNFAAGMNIQILDTATGRTFFDTMTPYNNVSGNAQYPYRMPVNRSFPAHGSISIRATNTNGAGAHSGYIVLAGANVGA